MGVGGGLSAGALVTLADRGDALAAKRRAEATPHRVAGRETHVGAADMVLAEVEGMTTQKKPWGSKHTLEAYACLLEAAAAAARRGAYADAENVARLALRDATSEARTLDALGYVDVRGGAANAVLRKIRGLAEGRLVRETSERCFMRSAAGSESGLMPLDHAREQAALARHGGHQVRAVRVRVTRVRVAR